MPLEYKILSSLAITATNGGARACMMFDIDELTDISWFIQTDELDASLAKVLNDFIEANAPKTALHNHKPLLLTQSPAIIQDGVEKLIADMVIEPAIMVQAALIERQPGTLNT